MVEGLHAGLYLVLSTVFGATQESPQEPSVAPVETVERLLKEYKAAAASKDSRQLGVALKRLLPYRNEEFFALAKKALHYRASVKDRKDVQAAARKLGIVEREDVADMVAQREANLQVLAVQVLSNYPGKAAEKLLHKSLRDKRIQRQTPRVTAAVIEAMGRLQYQRASREIEALFGEYRDKHIMKAAVRYFGEIQLKSVETARKLCQELEVPAPADPHSPTNPPASYWAKRWEQWEFIKDDVAWALHRITGQHFEPSNGQQAGDGAKALAYVEKHASKLGLR